MYIYKLVYLCVLYFFIVKFRIWILFMLFFVIIFSSFRGFLFFKGLDVIYKYMCCVIISYLYIFILSIFFFIFYEN